MSSDKQEWKEETVSNANKIEREIEILSSGHWNNFQRQYREFWEHAKLISNLFKITKPLLHEDREKLWSEFNSVCEEVKRKQNSEYENRKYKSEQHRDNILSEAERSRPCTVFGFAPPDIEEMKHLGQTLRGAGAMLSKHKSEMFGEHKQECFNRIEEISRIHDAWWDFLKQERSRRHNDFQARVRANLEKNYERHSKASNALDSLRRHADDLRDKIDSAWNDDWKDQAYVWLSEMEDKIKDIEQYLEQIEGWIREDEEKPR